MEKDDIKLAKDIEKFNEKHKADPFDYAPATFIGHRVIRFDPCSGVCEVEIYASRDFDKQLYINQVNANFLDINRMNF